MTRKRFVKLLMADGCSRNEANDWAMDVAEGYSYVELYCFYRAMPNITDVIEDAIGSLSRSVERIVQYICDCVPVLVNAISEVMPTIISFAEKVKELDAILGSNLEANHE